MVPLSANEIDLAKQEWRTARDDGEKVALYENGPKFREVYVNEERMATFFFERLDKSLWLDILQWTDYTILDKLWHTRLILKILPTLSRDKSLDAFLGIQYKTRMDVLAGITQLSRAEFHGALTKRMMQRMDSIRSGPKDANKFTATKEFLETLPESARTCHGCFGATKHFDDYRDFQIARCLLHSFHPVHCSNGHICAAIATEEDKTDPISKALLDLAEKGYFTLS
jgi:hypothetical protein